MSDTNQAYAFGKFAMLAGLLAVCFYYEQDIVDALPGGALVVAKRQAQQGGAEKAHDLNFRTVCPIHFEHPEYAGMEWCDAYRGKLDQAKEAEEAARRNTPIAAPVFTAQAPSNAEAVPTDASKRADLDL